MTERVRFAVGEPCWVDCMVRDMPAAQAFYAEVFGWSYVAADPGSSYVYAQVDGRRVAGLNPLPPTSALDPDWVLYLSVEDANLAALRLVQLGGSVLVGPMDAGSHGRFLIARDPAGALVALRTPGDRAGIELADVSGASTWYEVWVRDRIVADFFYRRLFGYDRGQARGGYATYGVGGTAYAGRFELSGVDIPAEVTPRWVVYVATPSCADTFQTAVAAGAKPVREPADSAFGQWAILRDPWGALFALLTRD